MFRSAILYAWGCDQEAAIHWRFAKRLSCHIFAARRCSGTSANKKRRKEFVERARTLDYWQCCSDDIIEREFDRGKTFLLVNKRPAMEASHEAFFFDERSERWELRGTPRLAVFDCSELRRLLAPYGLDIGTVNSVLLDVWNDKWKGKSGDNDKKDEEVVVADNDFRALFCSSLRLNISQTAATEKDNNNNNNSDVIGVVASTSSLIGRRYDKELGDALGVRFMEMRQALIALMMNKNDGGGYTDIYYSAGVEMETCRRHCEWLARAQSHHRWSWLFLHCPTCKHPLKMHPSKWSARCANCEREFYPQVSPVAITLVHDEQNKNCLLVKHKTIVGGGGGSQQRRLPFFTCISGFASPGETLEQTVLREVSEETGISCWDVRPLMGTCGTQSWPIPSSSLMLPCSATASCEDELAPSIAELDQASWFSRDQVVEAVRRWETKEAGRILATSKRGNDSVGASNDDNLLVPPPGTIAFRVIKNWALDERNDLR